MFSDAVQPPFLLLKWGLFWGDAGFANEVQVYCKRFAKIGTRRGYIWYNRGRKGRLRILLPIFHKLY